MKEKIVTKKDINMSKAISRTVETGTEVGQIVRYG